MGPTRRLGEDDDVSRRKHRDVLEKDRTELELEKVLFGDEAGFLNSLQQEQDTQSKALQKITEDGDQGDADMQDVPDEDLFFLDAGTTELPDDVRQDLIADAASSTVDEDEADRRKPLWHDSDDDRLTVSLASHTRLRKLRDTEDDDFITGAEYIRRLRRQYERLHPKPEWARHARKKRKINNDASSGSDSAPDSDVEITNPRTQSLSDLLRNPASLTYQPATNPSKSSVKFRPEVIDVQRVKDVTSRHPSCIDTLQFHPTYPLLLTGGPSSNLDLYHVSPTSSEANLLVSSIHIKRHPLHTAAFCINNSSNATPDIGDTASTRIFLSSRRPYYHAFDPATQTLTRITRPLYDSNGFSKLVSPSAKRVKTHHDLRSTEHFLVSPDSQLIAFRGTSKSSGGGNIHILSTTTHQHITSCRIDSLGGVADFSWWRDSAGVSIAGKNGEVSEFSVVEKRVIGRWIDEGAVGTTVIALGGFFGGEAKHPLGGDRYVAIGSSSGVVNIYDRQALASSVMAQDSHNMNSVATSSAVLPATLRPKPLKAIESLTTPTSHLAFHPSGQILLLASRWKKNALRLVNLPSCTVYRNWPTDKTPLGRISAVAWSAEGSYLAVGNEKGAVRLFQVRD